MVRRVMRVNLKGAFLASLAFFEQAKARGWGRIVNIASVRSFRPAEMNMIAYGVSKLGMHALTRAFADNGAPYGITANTVAPGMVVTENIGKRLTPEKYAEESAAIPLGRGATLRGDRRRGDFSAPQRLRHGGDHQYQRRHVLCALTGRSGK